MRQVEVGLGPLQLDRLGARLAASRTGVPDDHSVLIDEADGRQHEHGPARHDRAVPAGPPRRRSTRDGRRARIGRSSRNRRRSSASSWAVAYRCPAPWPSPSGRSSPGRAGSAGRAARRASGSSWAIWRSSSACRCPRRPAAGSAARRASRPASRCRSGGRRSPRWPGPARGSCTGACREVAGEGQAGSPWSRARPKSVTQSSPRRRPAGWPA